MNGCYVLVVEMVTMVIMVTILKLDAEEGDDRIDVSFYL